MAQDRQAYPLEGKKIVITRAKEQAGEFVSLLKKERAVPVHFPTITFRPVEPQDRGWEAKLGDYHWVIFTSANGVKFFMNLLNSRGLSFPERAKVCVIGPGTLKVCKEYGIKVDLVPDRFIAEGIVETLGSVYGKRVLIPRAKIAREVLPKSLRARGAEVDVLVVYETVLPEVDACSMSKLRESDVVTFTSPSTVENFFKILGEKAKEICKGKVIASIGPVTTEKAEALGLKVDVTSNVHSIAGLVNSIKEFYGK